MKTSQPRPLPAPRPNDAAREYLFDMLGQLAKLARQTGDDYVAIHLEAIMASSDKLARAMSDARPPRL